MQDWKEQFDEVLKASDITELLSGLYIDDGRGLQRILEYGERFDEKQKKIIKCEEMKLEDIENDICWHELTRNEMLKAMNSINGDLQFTMEICKDFPGKSYLPCRFLFGQNLMD